MTDWNKVYEAIARSLREFGYPDCTADMVKDTHDAMKSGVTGHDLPHDIVSMFAERQLQEVSKAISGVEDSNEG